MKWGVKWKTGLKKVGFFVIAAWWCVTPAMAWSEAELRLYDLVEDVGSVNFYDFLEVPSLADSSEIRKAFRKKSLILHPDRSVEVDAAKKFRHLVDIADVLKDADLRALYDSILENGLPSWKQPVYYYRVGTKLSSTQIAVFLVVLVCLADIILQWTSTLEKQYYAREVEKLKKKKVKVGVGVSTPEILVLEKPSLSRLFLVKVIKLVILSIYNAPSTYHDYTLRQARLKKLAEEVFKEEQAEREQWEKEEAERRDRPKKVKSSFTESMPVWTPDSEINKTEVPDSQIEAKALKTGPWSDEDISELARAAKRFPGGSVDRWERIAAELQRGIVDVIRQARVQSNTLVKRPFPSMDPSIAETPLEPDLETSSAPENLPVEKRKEKTVGWSSAQQKQLEDALRKFPNTIAGEDRWDRIGESVEGKTKADCKARVKEIVNASKLKFMEKK